MSNAMTQIKFTIESDIVAAFKKRCSIEGVSMASVIRQWMIIGRPSKSKKAKIETRPQRRKATQELIASLEDILYSEEEYRDAIPEAFQFRYELADESCEQLSQAISYLEDAY